MRCQRCKGKRILNVSARSKDMTRYYLVNVSEKDPLYEGYALGLFGGGGDEEEFTVCLDCGQLQGEFPLDLNAFFEEAYGLNYTTDEDEKAEIRKGMPVVK